jgi:hypothetical protein
MCLHARVCGGRRAWLCMTPRKRNGLFPFRCVAVVGSWPPDNTVSQHKHSHDGCRLFATNNAQESTSSSKSHVILGLLALASKEG